MRRLAAILVLLFAAVPALGQTPTLIQSRGDISSDTLYQPTSWKINLPNPAQGGNCIVVVVINGNAAPTITVADDKTNTYTATTQANDATNAQTVAVFFATNVIAGTQKVTVTFGVAASWTAVELMEFNNVATAAALDVQSQGTTTGTAITAPSMTTTVAGDLILQVANIDAYPVQNNTMRWTPGTGFKMAVEQDDCYIATQFQVQGAAGVIAPSITSSIVSTGAITKAIALKAAAAGAANPPGIRVRKIAVQGLENGTAFATYSGTAFSFNLPVDGNLIALGWTGVPTNKPTSITSSPVLTWNSTASAADNGTSETVWWWYAAGATPGTLYRMTVNFASVPNPAIFNWFDISGAAASPFDTFVSATGTNTTHPTPGETNVLINGPLITPTTSNGLILAAQQEDQHSVVAVTPGFFEAVDNGIYQAAGGDTDEGLMVYYNPNTAAVQIVWNYSGYEAVVVGTNLWASQAIAFKAAATASNFPQVFAIRP